MKITTLNKTLLDVFPSKRPSCADTLKARVNWFMAYSEVRDDIIDSIDIESNFDYNKQFVQYFLKEKYIYNESLNELK